MRELRYCPKCRSNIYTEPAFSPVIAMIFIALIAFIAVSSLDDIMLLLSGYMSVCILLTTGLMSYILFVALIQPYVCPECKTPETRLEPPVDIRELRELRENQE